MSKVILVTGANGGIGSQLVRLLAEKGHTVYIGTRNEASGKEFQESLKKEGYEKVKFVHLDVTNTTTINSAKEVIKQAEGRLDVLVNNAGISGMHTQQLASTLPQSVLREVMDTNFFGLVATTTAFVPLLRKSSSQAVILNVSSMLGSLTTMANNDPWTQATAYKTSKAAVNMFTIELAQELKKDGIKVNSATPGLVSSRLNNYAAGGRSERRG